MNVLLALAIVASIAAGLGLILAVRKIAAPRVELPATADWIDELSVERYRPMMRLLDDEELRFLRSQPGFTPKLALQFRRQRCQIFRGYLRALSGDFHRICTAIKVMMMQAREDRPDLATTLIRSQLLFTCAVIAAHCQLVLYSCGIGTVNVNNMLTVFDGLRLELRTLVPCGKTAGA